MQQMRFNDYNSNGQRIAGTYPIHRYDIGSGDSAIYLTVEWMKKLVNKDANSPVVRDFARQLTQGAGSNLKKINAVFEWIKNNVQYMKDGKLSQIVKQKAIWYTNQYFNNPEQTEVLMSPKMQIEEILRGKTIQNDCDDQSMLFASIMAALHIPVRFKIVSTNPALTYNHVYSQAWNNGWISADTIRKQHYLGFEPNDITRSFVIEV